MLTIRAGSKLSYYGGKKILVTVFSKKIYYLS